MSKTKTNKLKNSYRFSSLKDDASITGLTWNQDAGAEGFPAAVDGGLGVNGAADNNDFAIVVVGEERAEVGDGERRGVVDLAKGGGGGGEFDDGADGGVGYG